MLKNLCKLLTLLALCSVARAEFIAPNSKTLFVLPADFYKKYENDLPEIQKLVEANLKRKYFITSNFIRSFSSVDVPESELKSIRDKYPTYQYFFLLGETQNKFYLKILDYRLKTLFVKSESNFNQPVIKFLDNAFSAYEGDIFFSGNVIKAEGPQKILIKADNDSGTSLVGKAVYIYPSAILDRSSNYRSFPKGAILERVGSFYRAQIINPANVPIKVGDHVKVMKHKNVGTSSKGIRKQLQEGGAQLSKTSNDFDVTFRKFSYVFPYQNSLFICYLLPFTSNIPLETTKEIRDEVLYNIKEDGICQARVNEPMENLLFKRKENLAKDLYNPDVLKVILDKLKAGSILRPSVLSKGAGLFVKLEVVVQDGRTVIFNKSTVLPTKDIDPVINVMTIWLKEYQKSIPYVALVEEAVGDQLLLQIGAEQDIGNTQHYEIYRPESIKIESFEDIYKVTWEKTKLGNGTIRDKKGNSAIAYVRNTEPGAKIRKGDWVTFTDDYFLGKDDSGFIQHNIDIKREVGKIHIALEASSLSGDNDNTSNLFGADIGIDYYLPYSIIGIFSFKRIAGSGDFSSSASFFDGALGYAVKPPIKVFSYIDGFVGFKQSKYDVSELGLTGVGEVSFSGPYLGARMEVPIYKKFSLLGTFKISPFDTASNSGALGDPDSASGYSFELKPQFLLNKKWGLFTSLTYHTHTFEYDIGTKTNLSIFVTNIGVNYYY